MRELRERIRSNSAIENYIYLGVPTALFILGSGVLMGWFFDIQFFNSIFSERVAMKPSTAILLVLSAGGMLFSHSSTARNIISSSLVFVIFLTLAELAMQLPGYSTIIDLFSHDHGQTISPGMPSWITVLFNGIFIYYGLCRKGGFWGGIVVVFFGFIGLAGHLFDNHWLYYYWPEIGTGMAFHTCVAAVHIGVWMVRDALKRGKYPAAFINNSKKAANALLFWIPRIDY